MPSGLSSQRVTPHLARKARRLNDEGRVHVLPGSFVVLVEGDTPGSIYAVPCDAEGNPLGCPCVHHGVCSHILAARELNAGTNE